jgi:hypothetical protein
MLITIAAHRIRPSTGLPRVAHTTAAAASPSTSPLPTPTAASLSSALRELPQVNSPSAIPRTITVSVWVAAVAAHAGDDRHEHRERGDTIDGGLEQRDHRGRQERGHQVDAQPGQALSQRFRRGREGTLIAGDTGEAINVLGRLVLDDVDDVVNGDDADELVLFIDDRDREQVVRRDLPRDFLLVVSTRA